MFPHFWLGAFLSLPPAEAALGLFALAGRRACAIADRMLLSLGVRPRLMPPATALLAHLFFYAQGVGALLADISPFWGHSSLPPLASSAPSLRGRRKRFCLIAAGCSRRVLAFSG